MSKHVALAGKLVLDLSRLLPGPYCTMILADHGARVVAIEDRRFEEEFPTSIYMVNRNKEHMTLNLKTDQGKKIFYSLAERADIVVEGFRPGVSRRLGVDYPTLKAMNRKLIYCSITGYGQNSKFRDRVGHDVNYLSYGGALSLIGEKGKIPTIPGFQIGDIVGGGMNAAIGILLALVAREKTGEGQYIDISMTDGIISLLTVPIAEYLNEGKVPERSNTRLSHRYACYNVYKTRDDKYISIGAVEFRFWKKICEHFGRKEYIHCQYDNEKSAEMIDFFSRAFREKTRREWADTFSQKEVCFGEVLEIDELLDSQLVRDREMVKTLVDPVRGKKRVLGIPVRLSATPGSIKRYPPDFGQDTARILKELGYNEAQLFKLKEKNII